MLGRAVTVLVAVLVLVVVLLLMMAVLVMAVLIISLMTVRHIRRRRFVMVVMAFPHHTPNENANYGNYDD